MNQPTSEHMIDFAVCHLSAGMHQWDDQGASEFVCLMLLLGDANAPELEPHRAPFAEALAAEAICGNHFAHLMLCLAAASMAARNWPLPSWLSEILVLLAVVGRQFKRGPPRKTNNRRRDLTIAAVVKGIADHYGVPPTRNPTTLPESGCSVVAAALKRLNVSLSEASVAAIWRRRDAEASRIEDVLAECSGLSMMTIYWDEALLPEK